MLEGEVCGDADDNDCAGDDDRPSPADRFHVSAPYTFVVLREPASSAPTILLAVAVLSLEAISIFRRISQQHKFATGLGIPFDYYGFTDYDAAPYGLVQSILNAGFYAVLGVRHG
jgi:hypothetical protein